MLKLPAVKSPPSLTVTVCVKSSKGTFEDIDVVPVNVTCVFVTTT